MQIRVNITTKAYEGLPLPSYMTKGAAGMDIYACISEPIQLFPGEITLVPTGIALEIPNGYEAQMRPRSGLAAKHGITLVNSPGTIDSDYRGEIKIILINHGKQLYTIMRGDRIAQMVFCPVAKAELVTMDSLAITDRGDGAFGHTGK